MSHHSLLSQKQHGSEKPSVTSIKKQCLQTLRFPTSYKNASQKPKTHLLACMAQFIDQKPQIKSQEIDQYCCFDRMKKIIEKKKNGQKSRSKDNNGARESQKLTKFIQIQAKLKKMQQSLTKYSTHHNKNEANTNSQLIYEASLSNMFLTAPVQQRWKDKIVTQNNVSKEKSQGLPGRFQMKKKLREQGYHQYLQWQKKKIIDNQNDIREFVQTQIEQKVKSMLQERDIKYNELLKNEKSLQRSIIQKNLQIQNLKSKQQTLQKHLKQLQAYKQQYCQQNNQQTKQHQIYLQQFHTLYIQTFPNLSIEELKKYIDTLVDKCLQKFNQIQCKNIQKWKEEKMEMIGKIGKLEGIIGKCRSKENQLLDNLKEVRYEQSSATVEMDLLIKKEKELERLQKKILELYNDWYGKVPQSSKQVMRSVGYLQGSYQYQKMLQYIVVFQNKFSNNSKISDYLIKILRGIQRIRKILFPKTSSNSDQRKQIMDPLFILDRLQKYMKSKVYQIHKQSNCIQKGVRPSFIIQQEFLKSTEENVGGGESGNVGQGSYDGKGIIQLVPKHYSLSNSGMRAGTAKMRNVGKSSNKNNSSHFNKENIF